VDRWPHELGRTGNRSLVLTIYKGEFTNSWHDYKMKLHFTGPLCVSFLEATVTCEPLVRI